MRWGPLVDADILRPETLDAAFERQVDAVNCSPPWNPLPVLVAQLPPLSHWAIASQFTLSADAGDAAERWLLDLENFGIRPGLERMRALLQRLGTDAGRRLLGEALASDFAWQRLAELGDTYGHRLSGEITVLGNPTTSPIKGGPGTHSGQTVTDNAVMVWKLTGVLPTKFKGPDLNATASQVAIEEITLVHEGLELERPPRNGGGQTP